MQLISVRISQNLYHFIYFTILKIFLFTVFGSSVNGFAFSKSDLDISLTFYDHETNADLDSIGIIEGLADRLKKMAGIRNVQVRVFYVVERNLFSQTSMYLN